MPFRKQYRKKEVATTQEVEKILDNINVMPTIAKNVTALLQTIDTMFKVGDLELLEMAVDSLAERVDAQNSASHIVLAMGGIYNPELDSAKLDELEAFVELIKARERVREVEVESERKAEMAKQLHHGFGMFGL